MPVILFLATFDESYRAGLQALQQNHLAEARANLESAAKSGHGNARVWLALAQTYWKLKETGKADEAADRALSLSSGDAQVLRLLAVFYSEAGEWLKAGNTEADYALAAPNDRDALPRTMEWYLQARSPERAIAVATRSPGWEKRGDVRDQLGRAYSAASQMEPAAREFQAAIELNPYQESYYFDFANLLLQQQKFEPAIQTLLDARRNFDKSAQIELALGVAYYGLRRYREASAAFQRTIVLSPDVEQPYVFLGKMLDQIPDKLPELTRLFENFQKAHPQNYMGYLLHAKALLAQSSEPGLPETLLKRSSALNTRAAEPHFVFGILLQREHRFPDAAREFERAAALEPDDPATHYRLAQVYDRLGKREAATSERQRHAALMEAGRQ